MPKARENASDQVVMCLILHLIDHENNASSLNQSQSEVKQKTKQSRIIIRLITKRWLLSLSYKGLILKYSFNHF